VTYARCGKKAPTSGALETAATGILAGHVAAFQINEADIGGLNKVEPQRQVQSGAPVESARIGAKIPTGF
jgi:hypothetical protein